MNTNLQSPSSTDGSASPSRNLRSALAYLRPSLPVGWQNYFQPRHAGRNWGLSIALPGVQPETPKADQDVEPVAVAHRSSGNRTQEAVPGTAAVKRPNPWATFTTPEARSKEMKRRMSQWPLDAKLRWMHKGRV